MWRIASLATTLVVSATTLSGCGSGDSTVAKTPEPSPVTAAPTPDQQAIAANPELPEPAPPPAADPCAVNLGAPEILRAVAELPADPRSGQGWSPEALSGNYNECAPLSAVIVKANTNAVNPNTRVIMFHHGKFIGRGAPDTFGFNGIDMSASTGDTVALKYSNGLPGLESVVRFRWNGNGVELVANPR